MNTHRIPQAIAWFFICAIIIVSFGIGLPILAGALPLMPIEGMALTGVVVGLLAAAITVMEEW